ncbi:MAG: TolC family protein [Elusimicrobiota bacterium]
MIELVIKRLSSILLMILILYIQAFAENLTLVEAVRKGLKEDNLVKMGITMLSSANAGLKQAEMSRFGELKIKATYTKSDDPVYVFATTMKQGDFSMAYMNNINNPDALGNYMIGFEAGIPIFTGFSISNYIKSAKIREEIARDNYQRIKAEISFKIIMHWLNVLLMDSLSKLAANTVSSAENELKIAQMLKERGVVLGSDYYGAEAILSSLKGYLLTWNKNLELEKEKLAVLLGLRLDQFPQLDGVLTETIYPEKDIKELLASIENKRLDIKSIEKMINIYSLSESIVKNSILPTIQIFGSLEVNSKELSDFNSNHLAGIRIIMPIGDPGYFAKKELAKNETFIAREKLLEAKKQAIIDANESLINYKIAKKNIDIAKQTTEKAKQSLALLLPLYRQGRQSVLEVLRAQSMVMQSEASYYESLYKIHLFYAKILLVAEELNENTISEISDKLSTKKGDSI